MSDEGIQQAAELFKEKIQQAQAGLNRSQDILKAIREFLADLSSNIPKTELIPAAAQQEIIRGFEEIKNKLSAQ